jgi:hypothetical protein
MYSLLIKSTIVILALSSAVASFAQWTPDGVGVYNSTWTSYNSLMAPDGTGGAFLAISDRPIDLEWDDAFVVRVDGAGYTPWNEPVVLVASPYIDKVEAICTDESGGAYTCFMWNYGASPAPLNVQRLAPDGSRVINAGLGSQIADSAQKAVMVPDGFGGALVFWTGDSAGGGNLHAQRLDPAGTSLWTEGGEVICSAPDEQIVWGAVPVEGGGAIVVWTDYRDFAGSGAAVYVQRVDGSGSPLWDAGGKRISDWSPDPVFPHISANPLGGVVVAWDDYTTGTDGKIYAQYLNPDGTENWAPNGMEVSVFSGHQRLPRVACSLDGSTTVLWENSGIRMQIISAEGVHTFLDGRGDPSAMAITTHAVTAGSQIAADSLGGIVVTWAEDHLGSTKVYGRRFVGGVDQWITSPLLIGQVAENSVLRSMMANADGGMLVSFDEDGEQIVQRLDAFGNWGHPAGTVLAVDDVTDDEGGWVTVRCSASRLESPGSQPTITGYNVWRRSSGISKDRATVPTAEELATGKAVGVQLGSTGAMALGLPEGNWESVGFHAAIGSAEYDLLAPTRSDSTATGYSWEFFCVTTHTNSGGGVYTSAPDSGYSVDNLAPAPPGNLTGSIDHVSGTIQLDWDDSKARDLAGYRIFRGGISGFPADQDHFLGSSVEPGYLDDDPIPGESHYKVLAVDRHGNLSAASNLGPGETSNTTVPTTRNVLTQNHPNPFNPQTTIAFEIEGQVEVSLRVLDLSGRMVRSLIVGESRAPGRHEVTWNGRDDVGRQVASGTYFYRLEAGEFAETKRMVLVK